MKRRWPFPGDSPAVVARRVAGAYRQALDLHAPEVCAELDRTMREWGQLWIVPRVRRFDLDDWLSVADAADLAAVSPDTLRRWRSRGRIKGRQTHAGRWEYQARAVLAAATSVRSRGTTVGSGSSVVGGGGDDA